MENLSFVVDNQETNKHLVIAIFLNNGSRTLVAHPLIC